MARTGQTDRDALIAALDRLLDRAVECHIQRLSGIALGDEDVSPGDEDQLRAIQQLRQLRWAKTLEECKPPQVVAGRWGMYVLATARRRGARAPLELRAERACQLTVGLAQPLAYEQEDPAP